MIIFTNSLNFNRCRYLNLRFLRFHFLHQDRYLNIPNNSILINHLPFLLILSFMLQTYQYRFSKSFWFKNLSILFKSMLQLIILVPYFKPQIAIILPHYQISCFNLILDYFMKVGIIFTIIQE